MQSCATTAWISASAITWALIDRATDQATDRAQMHQAGCKGPDTVRCSRLDFKLQTSNFKLPVSNAQKVCHSGSLPTTGAIRGAAAGRFAGLVLLAGRLTVEVALAGVKVCATGSEALTRNTETSSRKVLDCAAIDCAAADASSTSAAFCCVTSSICPTA